jgi:hypothetical protein
VNGLTDFGPIYLDHFMRHQIALWFCFSWLSFVMLAVQNTGCSSHKNLLELGSLSIVCGEKKNETFDAAEKHIR